VIGATRDGANVNADVPRRVAAAGKAAAKSARRVKAVDVAERAGVSVATVSLVANGTTAGRVSEETRARVQEAIDDLGYVVHSAARSLATGRRHCVAFVAHDMTNPFIAAIASGVADAIGDDMQLLLAVRGKTAKIPGVRDILDFGVDGLLVNFPSVDLQNGLAAQRPIVYLDSAPSTGDQASVYFDLRTGARQLATHLGELGHRKIAYIDATRPWSTFADRRRNLTQALKQQVGGTVIRARADIDVESARKVVRESWQDWLRAGVTAIVTAADVMAYGVMTELAEQGVSVPGQLSIASFDDIAFSALTSPTLTSVRLPAHELGVEGAALLIEVIARGQRASRKVQLPTELIVRASTGPAPKSSRVAR
jgi:LacI family transcriptional regulator